MKKVIAKTKIKREKGYLYFVGTDEEGYLNIMSTEMARGRKKKEKKERSEEHTSELQSHSFISYAVFCLKKKKKR